MTFEVDTNGRVRAVVIEAEGAASPSGGRFKIQLTGDADRVRSVVDCRRTELGFSLVFDDGRVVDVAATATGPGEWLLQFPHVDVTAAVDRRRRERAPSGGAAAAGEQRIKAPMPGRIVRVLVKAGDDVAVRQGLVVVEAMKMENELASPKAGRVKEVAVTEGMSVEGGRLLVVIE